MPDHVKDELPDDVNTWRSHINNNITRGSVPVAVLVFTTEGWTLFPFPKQGTKAPTGPPYNNVQRIDSVTAFHSNPDCFLINGQWICI